MVWFRGSLILLLVLIGLSLLSMGLVAVFTNLPCKAVDAFVPVVPDVRVQSAPSNPDLVELNGSWRTILQYLQSNPGKAMPFINFVKANFFDTECGIRQPRIHFETLADQYQPIFT